MTMASTISYTVYRNIVNVHFSLFIADVFGIPIICLLILLCSSPFCCTCICKYTRCCKKLKRMLFDITQWLFWFLKREKTKDGDPVFIVAGYTAPVCYTYFLFYSVMLFSFHSFFSFFSTAVFLSYKTVDIEEGSTQYYNYYNYYDYLYASCNEGDVFYNYKDGVYYCIQIEVQFLKSLESATITFTVSAFFFAILTILLLKFSGGRKTLKIYRCKCQYKVIITLCIQAVFICLPRTLFLSYVIYQLYSTDPNNEAREGEQVNVISIPKGILDEDTFYVLAAICDAIATSMLTPWYCFKKKKNEDKDYSIPGEQNTHTFSPSEA